MRNSTLARRPIYAIALAATALTLTACQGFARPQTAPTSGSASTASTASTPSASSTPIQAPSDAPTVVGTLDVLIAITTPDAELPDNPSYKLLVKPDGEDAATEFPVDPDGTFALALPPGGYTVDVVELDSDDLGPDAVVLPLTNSRVLRLQAPATGCTYGGLVGVTYGRLPAGTQKQQEQIVERGSRNNNTSYGYIYRPDGGFVIAGTAITMPSAAKRPAAAQSCTAAPFTLVKSK